MKTIGVLALQGAFLEHEQILHKLGVSVFELRTTKDLLHPMDGLILPGGESTVIGKLLQETGLLLPLQEKIQSGLPVFGTCAGLILLAKKLDTKELSTAQKHSQTAYPYPRLATMDIMARRNAYGRQLGSFYTTAPFAQLGEIPMTFIRAPYIMEVGPDVEVLAKVEGKIVAARQNNQLVTAFHPELTGNLNVHRYFLLSI